MSVVGSVSDGARDGSSARRSAGICNLGFGRQAKTPGAGIRRNCINSCRCPGIIDIWGTRVIVGRGGSYGCSIAVVVKGIGCFGGANADSVLRPAHFERLIERIVDIGKVALIVRRTVQKSVRAVDPIGFDVLGSRLILTQVVGI